LESTRTTLHDTVGRWTRFLSFSSGIPDVSPIVVHATHLVFENAHVRRTDRRRHSISFGGLCQLFELTLLFAALERATSRRRQITLGHGSSLEGREVGMMDLSAAQ
jgi:hypothetical protein